TTRARVAIQWTRCQRVAVQAPYSASAHAHWELGRVNATRNSVVPPPPFWPPRLANNVPTSPAPIRPKGPSRPGVPRPAPRARAPGAGACPPPTEFRPAPPPLLGASCCQARSDKARTSSAQTDVLVRLSPVCKRRPAAPGEQAITAQGIHGAAPALLDCFLVT